MALCYGDNVLTSLINFVGSYIYPLILSCKSIIIK